MYRNKVSDSEVSCHCMDDNEDSFGNPEDAQSIYDNFLGIGKRNKQKKAEKKIKKAEKQLEKGHVKAAERKLKKGTAILNKIQSTQGKVLDSANKINDINQTKDVINATLTGQTESPNTSPGQIGSEAGATTMASNVAQQQSLGGSAGAISDSGSGGLPEDTAVESGDSKLSTPDNPKELQGVTVTSHKPNLILIIVVAVVLIGVIFFISKSYKKK